VPGEQVGAAMAEQLHATIAVIEDISLFIQRKLRRIQFILAQAGANGQASACVRAVLVCSFGDYSRFHDARSR